MNSNTTAFQQPTAIEKFFNRALGALIGLGIGPAHIYLLEVRGRKTGKLYATPVDPVEIKGKRYVVAPRGRTQWVRNAEAAAEIVLRRGSNRQKFRVRVMADEEKRPILKANAMFQACENFLRSSIGEQTLKSRRACKEE
jgi:deazaflavin-dependent oxidoreductase (nitroreductase family)